MEEVVHVIQVLEAMQESLNKNDANRLRELSNQTIHCASTVQDAGSITLAVIIYTLSKLIERGDNRKIREWSKFQKKFLGLLTLALKSVKEGDFDYYERYLHEARKSLTALSVNLKPYIQEVMRKASINKASRIYEHGISMGHTAQLLGITQWELAEYTGQKVVTEPYGETIDIKKRAGMAMEFLS